MIIAVILVFVVLLYVAISLFIAYRKVLPELEELLFNYGYSNNDHKKLARKLGKKIIMIRLASDDEAQFEMEVDALLDPYIDPTKK